MVKTWDEIRAENSRIKDCQVESYNSGNTLKHRAMVEDLLEHDEIKMNVRENE